jgi:2-dehydro-3-deoxyphosphogluconate aldolase/(4S)-4-hydroxy-2-oxoglutarate aldolase
MAKFSRIQVYNKMLDNPVVPLFYNADFDICKNVIKACYDGGLKVFEFTNRGDLAHEIFTELNKYAMKEMPDLILGVGSVIEAATAALYIQLGANFIVSPVLNPEMAKTCNRRKIAWIPGCSTISEISQAEELGAEIVKVFPADRLGGPKFIQSIKAPMPWLTLMATGGVEPNEENLKLWFSAGISCVGIGSQLFPKDIIKNKDYNKIRETAVQICDIIKKIKGL